MSNNRSSKSAISKSGNAGLAKRSEHLSKRGITDITQLKPRIVRFSDNIPIGIYFIFPINIDPYDYLEDQGWCDILNNAIGEVQVPIGYSLCLALGSLPEDQSGDIVINFDSAEQRHNAIYILSQLQPNSVRALWAWCGLDDSDMKSISGLNGLALLDLGGQERITDIGFSFLSEFETLETISLRGTKISDNGMKFLLNIKSLKCIILNHTEINGLGLSFLKDLPNLNELNLRNTNLDSKAFNNLKSESLRNLDCHGNKYHIGDLDGLLNCPSLSKIDFWKCQFDRGAISGLNGHQNLKELCLAYSNIKSRDISEISNITSLENLSLRSTEWDSADFCSLVAFANLKTLDICYNSKKTSRIYDISGIGNLKQIIYLNLSENKYISKGLNDLALLENLEALELGYVDISSVGIPDLSCLTNLRKLRLSGAIMDDNNISCIAGLEKLLSLELWATKMPLNNLNNLISKEIIEHLDIGATGLDDDQMNIIGEMKSIKDLCISRTIVSDCGIEKIENLKSMNYLDISKTRITDRSVKLLSQFTNLRHLKAEGTGISIAGAKIIKAALPKCMISYGPYQESMFE